MTCTFKLISLKTLKLVLNFKVFKFKLVKTFYSALAYNVKHY